VEVLFAPRSSNKVAPVPRKKKTVKLHLRTGRVTETRRLLGGGRVQLLEGNRLRASCWTADGGARAAASAS
jgi:hypothetical protein